MYRLIVGAQVAIIRILHLLLLFRLREQLMVFHVSQVHAMFAALLLTPLLEELYEARRHMIVVDYSLVAGQLPLELKDLSQMHLG